jgi:hypothetical protein
MKKQQWVWLIIVIAALAASVWYRVSVWGRLEQTSVLFIGIPAIIAAICALTPAPRSAMGTVFKAITLFICIAGIFLGEGFICLLMAAPLFYGIGGLIGFLVDRDKRRSTTMSCLILLATTPMSIEGIRPGFSFNREETIVAQASVPATPEQVASALQSTPQLNSQLPFYLRLGFPRPVAFRIEGTGIGAKEIIHFAGGEGKPGDLVLEVAEIDDHHLLLRAVSDSSHVAHWLKWEESEVCWSAIDATHTHVTWTLRYRRLLDPAWYFRPWEHFAVRLTATQLIHDAATPRPL